jgi:hypothetical protein
MPLTNAFFAAHEATQENKFQVTLSFIAVFLWAARSQDSAVGGATGCGLDREAEARVPTEERFSLLHVAHTGTRVHPPSCPLDTGRSFLCSKAAGA